MWMVVYVAQEESSARGLAQTLSRAGILERIRPVSNQAHIASYEVLVPETEVDAALEIIIDTGF